MMVIDSKTAIHIVNGWVNNTSSNQNYTHRATSSHPDWPYILLTSIYTHMSTEQGQKGSMERGGTQGLLDYPGFIHLLSSVFSKRLGSISSSRTIHAVSPNLHYQSLTRPNVYIHFLGLTWQTTPKKYLGSISYFTHRVFLQIKISA